MSSREASESVPRRSLEGALSLSSPSRGTLDRCARPPVAFVASDSAKARKQQPKRPIPDNVCSFQPFVKTEGEGEERERTSKWERGRLVLSDESSRGSPTSRRN